MNLSDMNWKTNLLIVVILLGASLEIIKRLPKADPLTSAAALRGDAHTQPYNVRAKKVAGHQRPQPPAMLAPPKMIKPIQATRPAHIPAMTKEQMEKLAASLPKATEFEHDKSKAKKKDGKDDEWEIVVDPKTGKRIKRRKKKVAKAVEKKEEVVQKEEPKEEETPPPAEEDDIDAAIASAMATGKAPVSNSRQADDAFASAEEWMRKLLSRPNVGETKRFIDHFNKALITPEVFYKVVNAMISDSRNEMKQLGVLCLGSTPSVLSFQLLAQVIKNERGGTPAQKDAEGFADKYKEIGRLALLERILRASTGSNPTVLALTKLEASATQYLNQPTQPQQQTGTGTQAAAAPARNYSANFQRFVPILTSLGKSRDQAIKDQSGRTLSLLQGLLNNSTSTPTAPSQPAQAGVIDPQTQQPMSQASQF